MSSTSSTGPVSQVGLPAGQNQKNAGLGTFLGVFTPTLLTILGAIMYLRFGWMVGHQGLFKALMIVLLGNAITLITTLSFSAIATNTRVGVGGAYYIISRSLGLELGGAIGIPLFLSQAFSVTLYAYAIAESVAPFVPGLPLNIIAFVVILGVGALSLKGADIALRSQIPIMVLVALSIVGLAAGVFTGDPVTTDPATTPMPETVGFWEVFAIFFPAVTGVMAGLGLSGDLADARKSIPRGSMAAALVGLITYLALVTMLSLGADSLTLRTDKSLWANIAVGGAWIILPGMWGAIFSSAVGSILGAPRTLQALAADHTRPGSLFSKLAGEEGKEPIAGMVVSLLIAIGAVFLGDLNAVAEVVSMFFLTVYGAVNVVAALETLSGNATWRPKFNAPWFISLAGGLACFGVMFLFNFWASIIAIAVEILLWLLFSRWERRADWGDMRRDLYEALIRWCLVKLAHRPMTARNWRPHVMIFADHVEKRLDLVRFANWFSQDRGVVTVCEIVEGDVAEISEEAKGRQGEIQKILDNEGIVAFPEVTIVERFGRGIVDVVQANGLAGLQSNTIIMGMPQKQERLENILKIIQRLERLNKSIIIGNPVPTRQAHQGVRRRIHIWWGGLQRNGDMMLLLAHLLTRNAQWRGAAIEVLSIASNENTQGETQKLLDDLLPEIRIEAQTKVIAKPKDLSIREVIAKESRRADIVFLGLATPTPGEEAAQAERMRQMCEDLGTVFFVKNASLFVGKLLQ